MSHNLLSYLQLYSVRTNECRLLQFIGLFHRPIRNTILAVANCINPLFVEFSAVSTQAKLLNCKLGNVYSFYLKKLMTSLSLKTRTSPKATLETNAFS